MSGVLPGQSARGRTQDRWVDGLGRRALRVTWLYVGLGASGVSLALMVRARLGLDPWDVLHQGIARRLGLPIGWVVIAVSALALVAWAPLGQRPGFGTLSNVVVVGLVVNAALGWVPSPRDPVLRVAMLAGAVVVNGAAIEISVLAIGAALGGSVGIGTLLYALSIGPLVHFFLPRLSLCRRSRCH